MSHDRSLDHLIYDGMAVSDGHTTIGSVRPTGAPMPATRCGICQAPADRKPYGFQCRAVPGHVADLNVGIWSDLTHPDDK